VATYLKTNLSADQRLIEAHPDSINRIWEKICKDCDFKYLSPLQWRHSYATIGALHLHDWYKGNKLLSHLELTKPITYKTVLKIQ
jgi:hypothetical protein